MHYKYFSYVSQRSYIDDNGDEIFPMKGPELLTHTQIRTVLNHLPVKSEAFATIQDYDCDGNIVRCPLYFDIDSSSLYDAWSETQEVVRLLEEAFGHMPAVWFSGSKGFHIIYPEYITHPRCHEIARQIASEFSSELDTSVYRLQSMWRCSGTINDKSGLLKIRVLPHWNLDRILTHSKMEACYMDREPVNVVNTLTFQEAVNEVELPEYKPYVPSGDSDFDQDMMPCMRTLWNMELDSGRNSDDDTNGIMLIFAKHCHRSGLTECEALDLFGKQAEIWKGIKPREYQKVIASVYRNGKNIIGCQNGRDSEILKPHCVELCHFNKALKPGDLLG